MTMYGHVKLAVNKVGACVWDQINKMEFYSSDTFSLIKRRQDMTMVARTMSVMTDKGCDDNV